MRLKLLLAAVAGPVRADERCGLDLQTNVCLEANPLCPGTLTPLGPNPGSWSSYQHDQQHTGWTPFSGAFPKRGTMLNGSLFEHTMSERLIFESDSSSWRGTAHWPTPDASMGTGGRTGSRGASPTGRRPDGRKVQVTLNAAVARTDKGPISPDWVEVLMGFPSGWTSSTADGPQTSAKPSTRGSRRASAATRAAVKAG